MNEYIIDSLFHPLQGLLRARDWVGLDCGGGCDAEGVVEEVGEVVWFICWEGDFRPTRAMLEELTTPVPSGFVKYVMDSREPSLRVRWINVIPAIKPDKFVSDGL